MQHKYCACLKRKAYLACSMTKQTHTHTRPCHPAADKSIYGFGLLSSSGFYYITNDLRSVFIGQRRGHAFSSTDWKFGMFEWKSLSTLLPEGPQNTNAPTTTAAVTPAAIRNFSPSMPVSEMRRSRCPLCNHGVQCNTVVRFCCRRAVCIWFRMQLGVAFVAALE